MRIITFFARLIGYLFVGILLLLFLVPILIVGRFKVEELSYWWNDVYKTYWYSLLGFLFGIRRKLESVSLPELHRRELLARPVPYWRISPDYKTYTDIPPWEIFWTAYYLFLALWYAYLIAALVFGTFIWMMLFPPVFTPFGQIQPTPTLAPTPTYEPSQFQAFQERFGPWFSPEEWPQLRQKPNVVNLALCDTRQASCQYSQEWTIDPTQTGWRKNLLSMQFTRWDVTGTRVRIENTYGTVYQLNVDQPFTMVGFEESIWQVRPDGQLMIIGVRLLQADRVADLKLELPINDELTPTLHN